MTKGSTEVKKDKLDTKEKPTDEYSEAYLRHLRHLRCLERLEEIEEFKARRRREIKEERRRKRQAEEAAEAAETEQDRRRCDTLGWWFPDEQGGKPVCFRENTFGFV